MQSFIIHFLICNIFLTIIIGSLLILKQLLRSHLSGRCQYHLGFLILILLAVPFLPFRPGWFLQLVFQITAQKAPAVHDTTLMNQTTAVTNTPQDWMNDFSISVHRYTPSFLHYLLAGIWLFGIFLMVIAAIKARIRLSRLEHSALPLQSMEIRRLFERCMLEMHIQRNIPIYSTAFIRSPVMIGLFKPRIYLPISLISDFPDTDIRYMLLHELQHYKHKDALVNSFINIAGIVYWFHPLVWYALKELQSDREIACDSSVLHMLCVEEYLAYGNTLINFAEKISRFPLSFSTGMGGSMRQIRKRILNIASYHPETKKGRRKNIFIFLLLAVLTLEAAAFIPAYASNEGTRLLPTENTVSEDLSSFFTGYDGCFVLYDMDSDSWEIYNDSLAYRRVSPDSTYKIYSALLALENQLITPTSVMKWNHQEYPISQWNQNQTLSSAMRYSVNWYFQALDQQAGMTELNRFFTKLDYGNQDLSSGISDYWLEASLKISALEQVELLHKFYTNELQFREENVQAVKEALRLSASDKGILYGKTGTGNVNGKDINGWFIGYVETSDNTYFFAVNVQNESNANGTAACDIALKILKAKNIY